MSFHGSAFRHSGGCRLPPPFLLRGVGRTTPPFPDSVALVKSEVALEKSRNSIGCRGSCPSTAARRCLGTRPRIPRGAGPHTGLDSNFVSDNPPPPKSLTTAAESRPIPHIRPATPPPHSHKFAFAPRLLPRLPSRVPCSPRLQDPFRARPKRGLPHPRNSHAPHPHGSLLQCSNKVGRVVRSPPPPTCSSAHPRSHTRSRRLHAPPALRPHRGRTVRCAKSWLFSTTGSSVSSED